MFQSREDTVRKIKRGMGASPFGIISEKQKKRSMQEQDILRLALDLCKTVERGTINIAESNEIPEKTELCTLLCETLAKLGKRVLFLCIRQQMADIIFDSSGQKRPLQDFLDGLCGVRDILSYDREKKVYQIMGEADCMTLDNQQLERLSDLLRSCGGLMDYVIVDGPDLKEGELAVALTSLCEASAFLISARQCSSKAKIREERCYMQEIAALSSHFVGYIICQTRDEWTLPPIWKEVPCVAKRCKRQMKRLALKKGILHLGWAAFFLIFVFVSAVFSANNVTLSICRMWNWPIHYSPWRGSAVAVAAALFVWGRMVMRYAAGHRTIRQPHQAEKILGVKLLENLPGGNMKRKTRRIRYERAMGRLWAKLKVFEWQEQNGEEEIQGEEKLDETKLDARKPDNRKTGGKIFMVTSTLEGEGKTTFAWNLAEMLSKRGSRVMLIDADTDSRLMTSWLQNKKHVSIPWDLQDFILARASAEQAILQITESKVYFLGLNREVKDAIPFLLSDGLRVVLGAIRQSMDYVILDGPPAFLAHSELLAKQADGILYVIGYDEADVGQILSGVQRMAETDTPVIGTVLCRQQK